jgi:hypothetical protein
MLDQFDRLRKRNAFMDVYKREKLFENGLEEFDDARYVMVFFPADLECYRRHSGQLAKNC